MSSDSPKQKLTATSTFFSVILAIALIALGQRIRLDLNRLYNPEFVSCDQNPALLNPAAPCLTEASAWQQLLIHSYVSLGILLLFLALMLYLRVRRQVTWRLALYHVAAVVWIWFGLEFLVDLLIFLFSYHKNIGWYVLMGSLSILSTILVIYVERKQAKNKLEAKH